jgi:hypothetical protein
MSTARDLLDDLVRILKFDFAHFSVKEYLESNRILSSDAKMFSFESAKEHRFLAAKLLDIPVILQLQ